MKNVKITAVRKANYTDLQAIYENAIEHYRQIVEGNQNDENLGAADGLLKKLVNVEDANTEIKILIAELFAEINNKVRDRI